MRLNRVPLGTGALAAALVAVSSINALAQGMSSPPYVTAPAIWIQPSSPRLNALTGWRIGS